MHTMRKLNPAENTAGLSLSNATWVEGAIPPSNDRGMLDVLHKTKQYLWNFVEIGFLTVLSIVLVHLILGPNSGVFVTSGAENVPQFANGIPAQGLVGLAIVLSLVLLIQSADPVG